MRLQSSLSILVSCSLTISAAAAARTAAVVGAGEHGLIAAVELQNRGYDVTVFEKSGVAVPILNSVKLDDIYDYLQVAAYPYVNSSNKGSSVPSLAAFASKYHQQMELLPASTALNHIAFDSVLGTTSGAASLLPPGWSSLLGDCPCQQVCCCAN